MLGSATLAVIDGISLDRVSGGSLATSIGKGVLVAGLFVAPFVAQTQKVSDSGVLLTGAASWGSLVGWGVHAIRHAK